MRGSKSGNADPEGFADWYALYRRKDARAEAVKAWQQKGLDQDEGQRAKAMAAVKAWRWAEDRSKIPLPASWLRGERWTDEAVARAVAMASKVQAGTGDSVSPTSEPWWIPALSCNAGAGNHQWIENDWERLERFSEIIIFYDCDEPGEKGAREVIQRLGPDRCRRAVYTYEAKDANDMLQKGCERADFLEVLDSAKSMDPEELRAISDFIGEVKEMFYPPEGAAQP